MSARAQSDPAIRARLADLQPLTGGSAPRRTSRSVPVPRDRAVRHRRRAERRRRLDGAMRQLGLDLGGTKIKLAVLDSDARRARRSADEPLGGRSGGCARAAGRARARRRRRGLRRRRRARAWSTRTARRSSSRTSTAPGRRGGARAARGGARAAGQAVNDGHAFALAEASLGAGRGGSTRDVHRLRHGDRRRARARRRAPPRPGRARRRVRPPHRRRGRPAVRCGNRGCLELYAGARAIADAAGAASFDEARRAARGQATSAPWRRCGGRAS